MSYQARAVTRNKNLMASAVLDISKFSDARLRGRGRELSEVPSQSVLQVERSIMKLSSSVAQLEKLINRLGTKEDTTDLRHSIAGMNVSIADLAKGIKQQVIALNTNDATPVATGNSGTDAVQQAAQQLKAQKLVQDFGAILQNWKRAQEIQAARESQNLPRPSPVAAAALQRVVVVPGDHHANTSRDAELERQALLQQQQQVKTALLDNAIQYHDALIEERDMGIAEIHRQIGEVNEMFQDLAVLINDQGVQIATIDEQITHTSALTQEGARELTRAARHQKSMRNKCLWIWLAAAVVVSIILILSFV